MLEFQVINVQRHAHETETLSRFWTLSRQILVRTSGPVFHKRSSRVCKSNLKKVYKACYKLSEKSEDSFRTCWSEKIKGSEVECFVLSFTDAELLAQI